MEDVEVKAFRIWLIVVAIMRFASVAFGYFQREILHERVFVRETEYSALAGRTFGIWTSVTCALCLLCQKYYYETGILLATLASFVLAFVYFAVEYVVYKTVSVKSFASPLIVSGTLNRIKF